MSEHHIRPGALTFDVDARAAVTEASSIGLPPGAWPTTIVVDDATSRAANLVFTRSGPVRGRDGELHGVNYDCATPERWRLCVFND